MARLVNLCRALVIVALVAGSGVVRAGDENCGSGALSQISFISFISPDISKSPPGR